MAGSTISGTTISTGITLGTASSAGTYASPLTITATGAVEAASGNAVFGPASNTWTVVNQGSITAPGYGVRLQGGGSIDNSGGFIEGILGIYVPGAAGTVSNSGTIIGDLGSGIFLVQGGSVGVAGGLVAGSSGVLMHQAGTVTNAGTIIGTNGKGVDLTAGGSVANNAGLIEAGTGVYISGSAGTVTNSSTIIGTTGVGVGLGSGGTIVDSGTIGGGAGTAVRFGGSVANRLVLDPGYHLGGVVSGGTSAGATNTLELGSAASAGTLSAAIPTEFVNFGTVTVDAGAQWTLTGSSSLSGITLTDFGTLTNAGALSGTGRLVIDPATLVNSGSIGLTVTLSGGSYLDNQATGTIGVAGDAVFGTLGAATVVNAGTIIDTGTIGYGIDLKLGGSVGNTGTGLIQGYTAGVFITGAAGTVGNSGTIAATGTAAGYGVYLHNGGSVGNSGTGLIQGYAGVYIGGTAGTVTNSATIMGTGAGFAGFGIDLNAGGSVVNSGTILSSNSAYSVYVKNHTGYLTNSLSGYIGSGGVDFTDGGTVVNDGRIVDSGGGAGVVIAGIAGTVTNSGTIIAGSDGIFLSNGGSVGNTGLIKGFDGVYIFGSYGTVTNSGTITGTAQWGIRLDAGGTIVDSGTISGIGGTAVTFGGTGSNLFVLEHGYKLSGSVSGSGSLGATNTLELAGSLGAAVTVGYTGLALSHFQDVLFGAGGHDTLTVSNTSGTLVKISGFTLTSDIIDLTAIGTDGTVTSNDTVNHRVTVTGSLGAETLQFDTSDGTNFAFSSDLGTGTDITIACFCRGTLILTERGEVAVEDLAIGDRVITFSDAARPIKWIGRRAYDGRFVAANRAVLPIRVKAGALAEGVPARDLLVSPEHALYIEGELVPAGLLANGATIRQVESVDRLEYFHIELAMHDVLLAEGAPAETFVDCDNRFMFHNGDEFAALYPDDRPERWEFCAPRVEPGSAGLNAIRAALLARAEALGRVTSDPDLHLIADGEIVRGQSVADRVWRFALPAGARALAIASRSVVPVETEASSPDKRALGVAVERIVLDGAGLRIEIGHDCPLLCEGFHVDEGSHRWSNGRGSLPEALLGCLEGDRTIEVHLAEMALRYPLDPPEAAPARRRRTRAAPARPIANPLAARAAHIASSGAIGAD